MTLRQTQKFLQLASALIIFSGLYIISEYNYLFFHTLAEVFSVAVAISIFMFAWNSRRYFTNGFFLFIGIVYMFVGGLDVLHTLTYKGMNILKGYDANLPTQLWIATQYLKSISLLISLLFLRRRIKPLWITSAYTGVVGFLLVSIFYWKIFPDAYVEGQGLTTFKDVSEYIISLILLITTVLLWRRYRDDLDPQVYSLVIASLLTAIAADLAFTLYFNVYGPANLIGHFLKMLSYYLIYAAIIETGLIKPYNLLFRNLQQAEQQYRTLFTYSLNGLALFQSMPDDYQYLEINQAFEKFTGLNRSQIVGKRLSEIHPVIGVQKIQAQPIPSQMECYAEGLGKYFSVSLFSPTAGQIALVLEDITERKLSEHRATLLLDITSALSQAATPEDVANVILRKGIEAVGAQRGAVALMNEDGTALELAESAGLSDDLKPLFEYMPLESKNALVEAIRTQQPVWFETLEEYSTRFPQRSQVMQVPDQAGASIPMIVNGRLVGVVGFTFTQSYQFTPDNRDFLQTLAHQCGQAIMRAQLHKQEQEMASIQERQRLARELHDAVSQALFAASITAEALPRLMERHPEKAQQNLVQLHHLIKGALTETRNLVMELRPPAMVTVEIDRLLHQLAEVVQVRKQIEIMVDTDHTIDLPPDIKLAFYRIAQEALNNIAKHAKATQAKIHLHQDNETIELVISDNGHGFDPDHVMPDSQGMQTMEDHAQSINAQLSIVSESGKGTRISVLWHKATANEIKAE